MFTISSVLDEKFFIIDKYNLNLVKNKLYGFTIINGNVLDDNSYHNEKVSGLGSYIIITKNNKKIYIHQDYNGSYGLYIFQKDDYFAISNSFIKLVNFIKYNFKISINEDFANSFISSSFCSISNQDTLVNEIVKVPKNYSIEIDLKKKKLKYNKVYYHENTINIDSAQGINLIDEWYTNWIQRIRNLKSKTNNFIVDVTGGFDSRIILLLILNSNIDLNEVFFNSVHDKKHTHKEDFEIAQSLAKNYKFKLNDSILNLEGYELNIEDSMNLSFHVKLGFHKQMFFKKYIFKKQLYSFTGAGGECLRDYWNSKKVLDKFIKQAGNYSEKLIQYTKNVIEKEKMFYEKNIHNCKSFYEYLYEDVRCSNHFGKSDVESYLANIYNLNPLLDPKLHKLKLTTDDCEDKNLLFALLFVRFNESLLNYDFDSNKNISEKTIKYAKQINKKYPLKNKSSKKIIKNTNEYNNIQKNENIYEKGLLYSCDNIYIDNYVYNIFLSNKFRNKFENYYSPELYSYIQSIIHRRNYFPQQDIYAIISIMKIIDDIHFSSNTINNSFLDWFKLYESEVNKDDNTQINMINKLLQIYNTARLDLKNYGNTSNSIEILNCSDENISISEPEWFKDNQGTGVILNSKKNQISFTLKCINEGKFKIYLRSLDVRDKNNNRFPIYLNYTHLYINGKRIKMPDILFTHDSPFVYEKDVKNGENITFKIKWLPFNNDSIYIEK